MIPGRLISHKSVFGDSPVLGVYGDSRRALASAGLRRCGGALHDEDARLFLLGGRVTDRARITATPDAVELFRTANVLIRGHGGLRYGDWYGKALSLIDIDARAAVVTVPCLDSYHREFVPRLVVRPVLDRLLAGCGFTSVHAASASHNGRGVIICGTTGSGKSTLLAGLLDAGCGYLSDDRALLKRSHDNVAVLASYPEDMRVQKTSQGPKYRIEPAAVFDGTVAPAYVFFLEHDGGDGVTPVQIGAAETAARLTAFIAPFTEQDGFVNACSLFADISGSVTACVIAGKGDPDRRCANVLKVLGA